jgi:hypothetical protein
MDALAAKYAGRIKFLFAYTDEAHPSPSREFLPEGYTGDRGPFTEAATPARRLAAARAFRAALKVRREVLVEPLVGPPLSRHFLDVGAYNPVFVVGPDGRLLYSAYWLDAGELDAFLRAYLARSRPLSLRHASGSPGGQLGEDAGGGGLDGGEHTRDGRGQPGEGDCDPLLAGGGGLLQVFEGVGEVGGRGAVDGVGRGVDGAHQGGSG